MEKYKPGVHFAAGGLMLKWQQLDQLMGTGTTQPPKDVNVFINLEGILHHLTMNKDLNVMTMFHRKNVVLELEASILNLVAHYRGYFRRLKCDPKVYLYYTDLMTTESQTMTVINQFYRSYYHNHYCKSPDFKVIGELMNSVIIPEIELIMSFVQNCYLVKTTSFDGSLVPSLISRLNPAPLNLIVTHDPFDTLYYFKDTFRVWQIKRRFSKCDVISSVRDSVADILDLEMPEITQLFMSELYYRLLLSVKGSKVRNIQTARGFGRVRLVKAVQDAFDKGLALSGFTAVGSILDIFQPEYREDIQLAIDCSSLDSQLALLGKADDDFVCSQLIDRVDQASLEALNNKRFLDNQINLQGLLT
jgi:hypothetical protein